MVHKGLHPGLVTLQKLKKPLAWKEKRRNKPKKHVKRTKGRRTNDRRTHTHQEVQIRRTHPTQIPDAQVQGCVLEILQLKFAGGLEKHGVALDTYDCVITRPRPITRVCA